MLDVDPVRDLADPYLGSSPCQPFQDLQRLDL